MKVKSHLDVNNLPDSETCHPNLSPNTVYTVIGIDNENYRLVNDSCEPILYPKEIFDVIDETYPNNWVRTNFDDGEYYIDPPEFSEIGFFEDYFDGVEKALLAYKAYLQTIGLVK